MTHCDGTLPSIVASTKCIIPLTVFYNFPFDLTLGDGIEAKVTAHNIYGDGPISNIGCDASVVLVPDPP